MPIAVTFNKIVMEGANVWVQGNSLEMEVLYRLESADGSERLPRRPEKTSGEAQGGFLNLPFELALLPPTPTIKDVILLLRDQIQAALAVKEGI